MCTGFARSTTRVAKAGSDVVSPMMTNDAHAPTNPGSESQTSLLQEMSDMTLPRKEK